MRQAVILAGGKGTRLAERLQGRPKPLIDIDGVPLLRRQIDALHQHGVTHILLLVNHEAEQVERFCTALPPRGPVITLVDDGEPRGTAGALLHAFSYLAERFLVVYGDTFFDVDISHFWDIHATSGAAATLFLHPNDHPFDSDLVELGSEGNLVAMHAAPHPEGEWRPNLVNAALYVVDRNAIAFWHDHPAPSDIARDLFPAMLRHGAKVQGYVSFEYIKDIGTPKRLDKALGHQRSGLIQRARRTASQRAVFLDRDGTINRLDSYIVRAEQFELLPDTAEAIRRLNDAEYRVVVVTNQPVLARGDTTPAELRRIHAKLDTLLGREGAFIDAIYHCPHHPDAGFRGEVSALKVPCTCRKPKPGMVDQAKADLNIDVSRSWLVGDSTADIALAQRCGVRSILVQTGEAGRDCRYNVQPAFTTPDLAAAVTLILKYAAPDP